MADVKDTYLTVAGKSEGLFKDRGSKFIGYVFPILSKDEVGELIGELKKMHHVARHFCYAYRLGADQKEYRANDDGEPSNSAGKPILGQIQAYDLTNVLIVVVRYFGGTKLGVGGLINAYRQGAKEAIEDGQIVEKIVSNLYRVTYKYDQMNDVMRVVKEHQLEQTNQKFEILCSIDVFVRLSEIEKIVERFEKIDYLKIEYLRTV